MPEAAGMNEPVNTTDKESLEAWLETRPHEDSITIAHRAAMRGVPVWLREVARDGDVTALPVLRGDLISEVASIYPTPEIRGAAHAFAVAANAAAGDDAIADNVARAAVLITAGAAAAAAAHAHAAHAAADNAARAAALITARADAWRAVEADRQMIEAGGDPLTAPLWPDENPLADLWLRHAPVLKTTPGGPFWIDWYNRALDGAPQPWPLLKDIALIEDDLWKEATESADAARALDAAISALIEQHKGTPLSQAAPVEFDFDEMMQQMQIVGFGDDVAHLRDPALISAFVDDATELRDGLTDFLEFSADQMRGQNEPVLAVKAAHKLLAELEHCGTAPNRGIRARRLVMLGKSFADYALDETTRQTLGPGLTGMMDSLVDLTRALYRQHFAPSLLRLRPLLTLELGAHDPDELLQAAEHLTRLIEAADNTTLARMSPEALAVMQDFLDELRAQKVGISEARSPEGVAAMRKKFAETYGAVAVAYGRYVEKGRPYVEKVTEALDWLVTQYRRWTTFEQVYETLTECPCRDTL